MAHFSFVHFYRRLQFVVLFPYFITHFITFQLLNEMREWEIWEIAAAAYVKANPGVWFHGLKKTAVPQVARCNKM